MKPFSMYRRVAAVLVAAALAPALTAWTPAARPAARILSCARVPITTEPATGGHQPPWDMPPVEGALWDIAARSSSSAVAVGGDAPGGLVARWNGTAWKPLNSPALAGLSFLTGVAVFNGGAWAVGQQDMSPDGAPLVGLPLLVRVTGTTVRQVPVPQAPDGSALQAVAAPSATDAWAVGYIRASGSLIWHWNGTAWKDVRLPAAVTRVVGPVGGVAATSRTNVWLVSLGRIVHWNGRRWTVIAPNIGIGRRYDLTAVAATSARNVFAIGRTNPGSRALMLHWNGRQWTCALTPRLSAELFAVSTSSPDNAWAVGNNAWPVGNAAALALHWNGRTWKQVVTPQPDGPGTDLQGVGLVPQSDRAWAVGFTEGVGTLMLHWNGTAWK